jgi:hypothetical protein
MLYSACHSASVASASAPRAERLAPAAVAVLADDFHQQRAASLVPRLGIGERLGERGFEHVGADFGDLHCVVP